MKKNLRKVEQLQQRFLTTCGWCGQTIPEDTEVFGSGAKVNPNVDLSAQEGQINRIDTLAEAIAHCCCHSRF